MIYGSVCSGIASETVAWKYLGWSASWYSEIDPFCCALLAQHHRQTSNLGSIFNVTKENGPVDILAGGTPCQDFSVNGKRRGLAGNRGSITLQYLRLVKTIQPRWVIWENVVGVLDSNGRAFFREIAHCGYGFAWRVLDLVGFGVPQQRRRLFLVGHSGGRWERAGAVLFDPAGSGQYARPLRALCRKDSDATCEDVGPFGWTGDPTPKCCPGYALTLRASQGGEGAGVGWPGKARRFTPLEWERLQGFPDEYTLIEVNGKLASDSQRRHALGNAFPPPILRWIGERINYLENKT